MSKQRFSTTLQDNGRGVVRLVVPFDPAEVWGAKPRYFVKGTVNGTAFEGSLGARGGQMFVPLSKQVRAAAGISAGDRVSVVLEAASAPRSDLPEDLASALAANEQARSFFDKLSTFYRNSYVSWIVGAKRPETRATRVAATIASLAAGKKQR